MIFPTFFFCKKKFGLSNQKTLLLTGSNIMLILGGEFLCIEGYTVSPSFSILDESMIFLYFILIPFIFILISFLLNEIVYLLIERR